MTVSAQGAEGSGTTVLGLGNVLVGDDGAGVAALADLVRRHVLPRGVQVLDGGVLGLHLLGLLEDAERLLVLDSVRAGVAPGRLVRLDGDALTAAFTARMSLHEVGFTEVLAAAELRGHRPRRLVVWGVQPRDVAEGIGLSAPVAAAVPGLADAAAQELRRWGLEVAPRGSPVPAARYPEDVFDLAGPVRVPATGAPGPA